MALPRTDRRAYQEKRQDPVSLNLGRCLELGAVTSVVSLVIGWMTVKVGRIIRIVTGGDVMRAGNGLVEARVRPRLPCGDVETSTFVRFIA